MNTRIILMTGLSTVSAFTVLAKEEIKPNIVLIMADDLGYSDLGCYGSEIATPALDALAKHGLKMTQFYNNARSCPSRASLLTGMAPHQAGIGWMVDKHMGTDGYVGDLSKNTVTLAQVLQSAGYATYMSGKWHVVAKKNVGHGSMDKSNWPRQRGFDRFFGVIDGAAHYWNPVNISLDNEKYPEKPYFLTDMIGDYAIKFLNEHKSKQSETPFFLYVTYNAPHWPLHARQQTIDKYIDKYKVGWDEIRQDRYRKMIKMKIIDPQWSLSPRDTKAEAWDDLTEAQQHGMTKRMATYAAMIDEMDQSIGSIIRTLKKNNQFDNTVIIFLADNGSCAEFVAGGKDKSISGIGSAQSWESYRLPWANVSSTPFKLYKHWMHEGGISTPFIVHWANELNGKSRLDNTPAFLPDIMATFVDIAGATYPTEYNGKQIYPMDGISLLPILKGREIKPRYFCMEHEANRMIRSGKWKLVEKASYEKPYNKKWELYDMETDRTELHDLADENHQIVEDLAAKWQKWAETHKVLPLDGREHGKRF